MALVTDIRGECKAGATPQTTRYPTRPARPNVKKLLMKAAPVILPSATAEPIPAVTVAISRVAFCQGVMARVSTFSSTLGVGRAAGGGVGRGAGGRMAPWWTTIEPRTTSSVRSILKALFSPMDNKNLVMLFEYRVDDCVGSLEGRSV